MTDRLKLPETRWGACAGHLIISGCIFLLLFLVIALLLFPGALFRVAGGIDGIKIIAGVDLVLGPLLTLIIYNKAKPRKELYRDLAMIGTVQFAALFAGMFVVYESRPAVVTYVFDTFHTSKVAEFVKAKQAVPELNLLTPKFYYLDLPEDEQAAIAVLAQYEMVGEQARLRSDLYLPLRGDKKALRGYLRVGSQSAAEVADDCLLREVSTPFVIEKLCFDAERFKFFSSQGANP
ncbi:MAG: hypothetical protein OER80_03715 [Gammaproteobacteria bacterium]|nr:hypothetical protein [Gammaproteobacteria bacterium]MDH3768964.1 hypothetical protein [Gammaproteobacteria bacterium]